MHERSSDTRRWDAALDVLYDIVGCFVFSAGTLCFSAPNNIAPGGVSGVSILINYLTGLPISLLSLLLNIPLLILAWLFLGHRFTVKTIKSVVILTVMLEVCDRLLPVYEGEVILAALYGGVLSGIGLAVVFLRSSTTGGTDIVARLIQLKCPTVSVGRLLLIVDGFVLLSAAIVYRNIESALYALIAIFTSTRLIDSILYGLDTGKVLLIVSEQHEALAREVNDRLGRGCTLLSGRGTYTNADRPVLLCAVRKAQTFELKKLVMRLDPHAFLMALDAGEIIGEGFRPIEQER